jgi:hypothetical protein
MDSMQKNSEPSAPFDSGVQSSEPVVYENYAATSSLHEIPVAVPVPHEVVVTKQSVDSAPGVTVEPSSYPPQQQHLDTDYAGDSRLIQPNPNSIPEYYIQFPAICCACRYDNCDFPSCFGYKGNCLCICCEQDDFCCKCIPQNEKTCCVLSSSSCEIVSCVTSHCRCYRQCCCCEVLCGCPLQNSYIATDATFKGVPNRDGSAGLADAIICK